jgi:CheY-like chemotaxis protein
MYNQEVQEAKGGEMRRDDEACNLRGKRILVVEDQEDARNYLKSVLEICEAQADVAANPIQAYGLLRQYEYDLILSDINMPCQDGNEFLQQVRRSGYKASSAPAIAITALNGQDDQASTKAAGFCDHIVKPVEYSELVYRINRVFARAS